MDFILQELDPSLARMEWTINMRCPDRDENLFRLEHHPSMAFSIICESRSNEANQKNHTPDPYIQFWMRASFESENPAQVYKKSGKSFYTDRLPCAIFVSLGESRRYKLKEIRSQLVKPKMFKSVRFLVADYHTNPAKQFPFTWKVWIYFDVVYQRQIELLEKLEDNFLRQIGCDVDFLFENNQHIGGHVAILSASSPVLAAMFQHNTQEAQTRRVRIEDVSFDIFNQFLFYLYAGCLIQPLNEETA